MSLTRKEHEAALRQERDWLFETALRYWDRPHSLRGNVLRIRMVGGREYHMKQLPPTWKEVLRREEPGYRKRHPDWEFPTE